MIIDAHAHAFPRLGGPSGGESGATHLAFIQHHVQYHVQGYRRSADGVRLAESPIMPSGDAMADMPDVNLRATGYGRIEATVAGVDYFLQWYPCSMQDMTAPPELMLAHMDYLGVDKAVLQHDHVYGTLNEYLAECVRRYPDRFIGLAQIREWEADQDAQLERLDHAVRVLGLRGLYFAAEAFAMTGFQNHLDDARYEPLWDLVRRLKLPVFWYLYTSQRDRLGGYLEQVRRLDRWVANHPDIPCVYTHGIETIVLRSRAERFIIPDEVWTCLRHPNLRLEIMLHLMAPDTEYPYPWAMDLLKRLYDTVGPERLVWGSDMPAAERSGTYSQSMNYIRLYADFMSERDKALFFGDNAAALFDIE